MANEIEPQRSGRPTSAVSPQAIDRRSFGNIDASDLKPPQLKLLAGQSPEVTRRHSRRIAGEFLVNDPQHEPWPERRRLAHLAAQVLSSLGAENAGHRIRRDRSRSRPTASIGTFPISRLKSGSPATRGPTLGSLAAPSPKRARTSSARARTTTSAVKPIATLTYDVLWLIDLPNGQKQLCVFKSARTGVKPTQNFISTTKAMGVDQYYQRYRIIVQKKTGPTGDPYFAYDYQYIGEVETVEEAKALRNMYDAYAKSGFVVDTGHDDDAPSSTAASPKGQAASDFVPRDTDDIPFMVPWQ